MVKLEREKRLTTNHDINLYTDDVLNSGFQECFCCLTAMASRHENEIQFETSSLYIARVVIR